MDNAAYDLRAIFQKTTTETVALAARGIRDYGREEAKPKAEEPRVPEPQEPVPKEALKTAKAAEVGR